jgi:hypothetical protein
MHNQSKEGLNLDVIFLDMSFDLNQEFQSGPNIKSLF